MCILLYSNTNLLSNDLDLWYTQCKFEISCTVTVQNSISII